MTPAQPDRPARGDPCTVGYAAAMDRERALAAFDEQVRRHARADVAGARVERVGGVVRHVSADEDGWNGVVWSCLDEGSADAAIAGEGRHFAALGRALEWKLYAYDRPSDLPQRLIAAGFEPEPEETVMVAEIAELGEGAGPPSGVRLLHVIDEAGVELAARVHEEVFGADPTRLRREMLAKIAEDTVAVIVALAGERAVSAARVELPPGTEFASLWGGGTLPAFRGRGIYRALVAHRARLAAARGYRYVQVDALPASRAILERLGFAALTTTTPYVRRAG
jgi:ribosomal protein S18 acetylase RimI-like enzyme